MRLLAKVQLEIYMFNISILVKNDHNITHEVSLKKIMSYFIKLVSIPCCVAIFTWQLDW